MSSVSAPVTPLYRFLRFLQPVQCISFGFAGTKSISAMCRAIVFRFVPTTLELVCISSRLLLLRVDVAAVNWLCFHEVHALARQLIRCHQDFVCFFLQVAVCSVLSRRFSPAVGVIVAATSLVYMLFTAAMTQASFAVHLCQQAAVVRAQGHISPASRQLHLVFAAAAVLCHCPYQPHTTLQ